MCVCVGVTVLGISFYYSFQLSALISPEGLVTISIFLLILLAGGTKDTCHYAMKIDVFLIWSLSYYYALTHTDTHHFVHVFYVL